VGVPVATEVHGGNQIANNCHSRPQHGGYPTAAPTSSTSTNEVPSETENEELDEIPNYEIVEEANSELVTHVILRSEVARVSEVRLVEKRENYTRCVVMEVKNRFGKPERTQANMLAVRRYALDIMTRHGVRPTHIAQQLPMVVELVFASSAMELEAAHMQHTLRMADERRNGYSWFRRLVHAVSGHSPGRRWY
jgi:transglutaminase/protease-like cytokinesis protein 3